jgi:flavin reductase (DIM6/NTAB) family NADH-FMN oxidoreductase RutF
VSAQRADQAVAGPDDLRRLFRRHAAAVAVITTTDQDRPVGLLVTSLASVSAEPPLVSFNVSRASSSWPALHACEHVGLHVLAHDQEDLAARFARKGADRFSGGTGWQRGPFRVPLLDDVAARSVAVIEQRIPAGDHVIVVARVLDVDTRDDLAPLLHHDGAYHRTVRTDNGRSGPPSPPSPSGSSSSIGGSRLSVVRSNPLDP